MRIDNEYVSFIFDLEQDIDLSKLSKSKNFLSLPNESNFLFSVIENKIFFIVFKSGKVRITYPNGDVESLQKNISEFAPKISELFNEVKEKAKIKANISSVISKGRLESEKDGFEIRKDICEKDCSIPVGLFFDLAFLSPMQLFGQYNHERLLTFSGEKFGRKISAKNKQHLEKEIKKFIEQNNLGLVEIIKPKEDEIGAMPFSSFRVYKSKFVYGLPPTGRAECYFIQALIRGAFAAYLKQENINVIETKCWRKGDVYCEFNVYLLKHS
ncbi:MAG: V4R domain-containing protein [Candidatus Micrarchaeia archaeon]